MSRTTQTDDAKRHLSSLAALKKSAVGTALY
jgi:hypothetical protein